MATATFSINGIISSTSIPYDYSTLINHFDTLSTVVNDITLYYYGDILLLQWHKLSSGIVYNTLHLKSFDGSYIFVYGRWVSV